MDKKTKVLVTGAGSPIGHSIIQSLVATGVEVTGTYRIKNQLIDELANLPIHLIQLDICHEADYKNLPGFIDVVVHVASELNIRDGSIEQMLRTNVFGVGNIQKYSLNALAKKIIFISSLSIHGTIQGEEVNHITPVLHPDLYGATKFLGERIFCASSDKVPTVAIRLPGVLSGKYHSAWIPKISRLLMTDNDVHAYSLKSFFNNAIYAQDLSVFIVKLAIELEWQGFHAFPIGASDKIRIIDVVQQLKKGLNSRSRIYEIEGNRPSFTVNSDYAISNFSYMPHNIRDVLNKYIDELRQ